MRRIKYYYNIPINKGTEESPEWVDNFFEKSNPWSEINEEIAKKEAHNGVYTIEDDGVEEITEPTQLDKIEAQVVYTAIITDTLLEV